MESTTLFTLMNREVKTNRARTFLKCTGECSFFAYAYSLSVLLSALATCIHLLMVIKASLNKKKQFFSKTGRKIPSLFNCSIDSSCFLKPSNGSFFIGNWQEHNGQRADARRSHRPVALQTRQQISEKSTIF